MTHVTDSPGQGWERGQGRTTQSLTKASAKSCTWDDISDEPSTHQALLWGAALLKGAGDPGGSHPSQDQQGTSAAAKAEQI